jgi:hypothetical protein
MGKGAIIALQTVRGVCVLTVIYRAVLHINGGDSKDWGVKKMTKQEFWRLVASKIESCEGCPVQVYDGGNNECYSDCAKAIKDLYERLERKE